jgi:putative hydrolase
MDPVTPSSDQPPPFPLGDALNDVPLFREIQRVLQSSSGPVNWELARQVGIATASWGQDDPAAGEDEGRALADTMRAAELAVVELTGLPTPAQVTDVRAMRRSEWVELSIRDLRELIEPVAARLSDAFGQMVPGAGLEGAQEVAIPGQDPQALSALMQGVAPLLMGAQVGSVLGSLAQRVFGQYDLAVPRPGGTLSFVLPNLVRFEQEWSLPPMEFRAWVALHEVTHRLAFAGPWAREHFLSLVKDVIQNAELNVAGLAQRLESLDVASPDALGEAVEGMANLFGEVSDPEQRLRVVRVQAFMAAAEGYGDHVTEAVGRRMLTAYGQIDEALRRHREGRHTDLALERLLGLETTPAQYEAGAAFCRQVAEDAGEAVLSRMWESTEALPSLPELEEPTLWLARTA